VKNASGSKDISVFPSTKVISVIFEAPLKALEPIDVTEFGMVNEVKLLQLLNDHRPIDVTELGMVTEVKLLQ
jgi:phosphatidylserine decarboxylase